MKLLAGMAVAAWLSLSGMAWANDQVLLFKDFAYGTTKEEFKKKVKAPDCGQSADGYDVSCLKNYDFLGYKWTILFAFENDKLVLISLTGNSDYNKLIGMVKSLSETFIIVSAQSATDSFDFISIAKSKGIAAASDALTQFERVAMLQGKITYVFLEGDTVKHLLKSSNNLTEIVQNAPINLREIDLEINADGAKSRMSVRFVAPIKAQQEALENAPAVKEKF
jgi:hypothetical protein